MEDLKLWLQTGAINIFGRPFGGKDTVGRELAEIFSGAVIGGGDILRSDKSLTDIHSHINVGKLAPTEEFRRIIVPYLSQPELKDKPLILSSVGRWHGEEPIIIDAAQQSCHPLKAVIYIEISEAELHKRWELSQKLEDRGGRKDDAEHILDKRIEEFDEKTKPVIEFYRQKGLLIEVHSQNDREKVLQEILQKLVAFSKNNP